MCLCGRISEGGALHQILGRGVPPEQHLLSFNFDEVF